MIGEYGNEVLSGGRLLRYRLQQPPDLLVSVGDFTVVGCILVLAFECARRVVRQMRIVEVNPQEVWFAGLRVQPLHCAVDGIPARPFGVLSELLLVPLTRHLVVVNRESIVEADSFLQNRRTDEGSGVPALLVEDPGERPR